jgi:hypothetical protein
LDPSEREAAPSAEAAADRTPVFPRRIAFACDEKQRDVRFIDGPILRGKDFELFSRLHENWQRDLDAGKRKKDFTFVKAKTLAQALGMEEQSLRQRVARMRRAFAKQFTETSGYTPDSEDVIQSQKWYGYRLNPYLLQVASRQIGETASGHSG